MQKKHTLITTSEFRWAHGRIKYQVLEKYGCKNVSHMDHRSDIGGWGTDGAWGCMFENPDMMTNR